MTSPNPSEYDNALSDIALIAPNDVWAVGHYLNGNYEAQTLTLHWDGTQWSVVPRSNYSQAANRLYDVQSLSPNEAWAVGQCQGCLGSGGSYRTLTEQYTDPCVTATPSATSIATSTPTRTATTLPASTFTSTAAIPTSTATRTPTVSATSTSAATVEPELAILQYVINQNPGWNCQGPSGSPGHRRITGCIGSAGHAGDGVVDNYGGTSAAQMQWQIMRQAAQGYPIFGDTTFGNGYPGYYAGNNSFPYAHYEDYFYGSVWVMGAVSTDDTNFRFAPSLAAAIFNAARTLGYLPPNPPPVQTNTPTPTSTLTPTPATATPTVTATVTCQNYGYSISAGTMIGGADDIGNHCDDCATTITLPFPVTLYDQTFTTAQAGSNGFLGFGDVWTHFDNSCLPRGGVTYKMAPFWVDQLTNGVGPGCAQCGIYTATVGTAPNRTFIVEFRTVYYNQGSASPTLDYEIQLQEGQSTFRYVYGLVTSYNADSALTIGVQKSSASNLYTRYYCDPTGDTAPDLAGQQLTWAYPPCATATVNPTSTATATSTVTSTATSLATTTSISTSTPTLTTTPTPCPIQFTDVEEGSAFYPYIRCLACRGILGGYADGTFRPGVDVTRGQIAKIVSNAAGYSENPDPQIYEDVPSDNPFYQWVNRLSRRGHMGGYPCGGEGEPCDDQQRPYFRPYNNVTRGQTAKIVSDAFFPNCNP